MRKVITILATLAIIICVSCKDTDKRYTTNVTVKELHIPEGNLNPVPEPCSMILLASGLGGLAMALRRRGKK